MKKLFKLLTNKIVVTAFFFLLQIAFTVGLLLFLLSISSWVYLSFSILSLFVCLFILGKNDNPGYKLAWVVPILLMPLFGGMMYLSFGRTARLKRKDRKYFEKVRDSMIKSSEEDAANSEVLGKSLGDDNRKVSELMLRLGYNSVYANTAVEYYPLGEDFLAALLRDLEKAEKYIFLEYFIIERGKC